MVPCKRVSPSPQTQTSGSTPKQVSHRWNGNSTRYPQNHAYANFLTRLRPSLNSTHALASTLKHIHAPALSLFPPCENDSFPKKRCEILSWRLLFSCPPISSLDWLSRHPSPPRCLFVLPRADENHAIPPFPLLLPLGRALLAEKRFTCVLVCLSVYFHSRVSS